jgi:hypothetical protein
MRTIIIEHGDPRKEKIRKTIRHDISDEPAEEGPIIKAKDLEIMSRLAEKNYSNLTEEEQKEYERLFSKNDNTEEEN